jgi:hypothetical protein
MRATKNRSWRDSWGGRSSWFTLILFDHFCTHIKRLYAQYWFTLLPFQSDKGGMPRGRPLKGEEVRGRLTLRLPPDLIAGVKRAAKRRKMSQADYIDAVVRPALIAEGFIKEKAK